MAAASSSRRPCLKGGCDCPGKECSMASSPSTSSPRLSALLVLSSKKLVRTATRPSMPAETSTMYARPELSPSDDTTDDQQGNGCSGLPSPSGRQGAACVSRNILSNSRARDVVIWSCSLTRSGDGESRHPLAYLEAAACPSRGLGEVSKLAPPHPYLSRRRDSIRRSCRHHGILTLAVMILTMACPNLTAASSPRVASFAGSQSQASSLSARELSRRALPGHAMHMAEALRKRQSTSDSQINADHRFEVSISQPRTCAPLNVTWDPTKGTPPFTLMIIAELWFQLAVVTIPESYADTSLRQWLFQYDLPSFKDASVTRSPSILAAIVDSSGQMANTSTFIQVDNSDESCDRTSIELEFQSWSQGAPVQCGPWQLGWNITGTGFKGPMLPFILPERQPPILLTPPANLAPEEDGTGGMEWTVTVPGGTTLLYSITDTGNDLTGGVGGKNLVAVDQYIGTSCNFKDKIGLPAATVVAPSMNIMPDSTMSGPEDTVVHGAGQGSPLSTGDITGVALGVAAVAGLVLALFFLCLYRRNQKKRETLWEMPGGSSNYPKGMPVDRRLATGYSTTDGIIGRADSDSVALTLNPSLGRGSFLTMSSAEMDAHASPMSSPPTPSHVQMPYSDISPRSGPGSVFDSTGPAPQYRLTGSGSSDSNSLSARGDSIHRSASDGARTRAANNGSLANAYRTALSTTNPTEGEYVEELESVPLTDRHHSTSAAYVAGSPSDGVSKLAAERSRLDRNFRADVGEENEAQAGTGETTRMSVSGTSLGGSSRSNNVVVHSDAGLLLDDSLSDDGEAGCVELPPDYDSVPVRMQRDQGNRNACHGQAGLVHTPTRAVTGDQDISQAYNFAQQADTDLDDATFWRS